MGVIDKLTPGSSNDYKDLNELDDEKINEATEILKNEGGEVTKEKIAKQATHLLEIEEAGEGEFKVGFVQDREETSVSDKTLIAPDRIKEVSQFQDMGYLERGGEYVRILTITDYPSHLAPGALTSLYTTNANVRVVQHITPRDIQSVLKKLKRKLSRVTAVLNRKRQKGDHDRQEEQETKNTVSQLIWDVITGKTKLFDHALYLEVVSDEKRELDNVTRNILGTLGQQNIDVTVLEKMQTQAQQAVCPAAKDSLKGSRHLMQETCISTMFPFVGEEVVNPEGLFYGKDSGGRPIFIDPYDLSSYIEIIAGKQGSGKSFAKMYEILLQHYQDPTFPIWALDPQSDFAALAREIGGEVIQFGGDTKINPLHIEPTISENVEDPYQNKCRSVMGMYQTLLGDEMDMNLKAVIYRVMHLAYYKYGITPDRSTHGKKGPIIQDHIEIAREIGQKNAPTEFIKLEPGVRENEEEVKRLIAEVQNRMSPEDAEYARFFYNALESFHAGGVNSNLNGRTNINLSKPFVVFDMSMFADSHQAPLMMHVVLDLIYQRCQLTKRKDMVVVDEAHYLLNNRYALEFLNLFARHHRHSNTRISLLSQTADEFLVEKGDDNLRTEIYETADLKRLYFHKNISDEIEEFHDLTTAEKNYITTARQGEKADSSECLLEITGAGKIPVELNVHPYEKHVVDEDLEAWEYLYEDEAIDDDVLEEMQEKEEFVKKYNVPSSVFENAGVSAPQVAGD
jgi:hypothetical protein